MLFNLAIREGGHIHVEMVKGISPDQLQYVQERLQTVLHYVPYIADSLHNPT